MRLFSWVVCLLASANSPAFAADLGLGPAVQQPSAYATSRSLPPYDWSGFYIGVNAGYGSAAATENASLGTFTAPLSGNLTGAIAGGQLGWNIQFGHLVAGLELVGEYSDQSQDFTVLPSGATISDYLDWLIMGRARFGVAFDRVLLYAAGGGGYGGEREEISTPAFDGTGTSIRPFWTVGAGLEFAVLKNFTIRAEYLFAQSFNQTSTISPVTITNHMRDNIGLIGLSYKF